ncbi:hypothetical protein EYZ11_006536 [Aspergillus tanneri]|uniref:DMAP1-binding domain-containing protein n=1 Tax=Aspergillus tanneri TaxID=1220188 RepID=A0A4S3JF94_9EURO|nr:hypothetical protein EYZ11_006536 [Aspergillus tanneri]
MSRPSASVNMAEHPEIQSALRELDKELEEGDITEKGYQKRRTLILSQFFGPNMALDFNTSSTGAPSSTFSSASNVPQAVLNVRPPTAESTGQDLNSQSPLPSDRGNLQGSGSFDHDRRVSQVSTDCDSAYLQSLDRFPSSPSYDSLFLPKPQPAAAGLEDSRTATLMSQNYAFNPGIQHDNMEESTGGYEDYEDNDITPGIVTQQSTMLDSQQGYFSDFAGQQQDDYRDSYGGGDGGFHRYSQSDTFSPTANMAPPLIPASELPHGPTINHLTPLEPREIPFAVNDPHDKNTPMSNFDNLPTVLRYRARVHAKQAAYWVLDQKGKEIASITWDKLASRAEKVAQVIRDKSNLYRGDRVALIYRDSEIIEFAVALMGCFIAGVVAVPINSLEDYQSLNLVLTSTQAHLALTTENNLKNFQRDITTQKLNWPRGVEWWKTNEFGSYHPKRKDDTPPLVVPDLAYIEFARAPTGDLRGVVMSHRTIMHQMACLSAVVSTVPNSSGSSRPRGETLISYLDPRQGIGMILGILLTVYGGHTSVWLEDRAVETPGLYAHLITKYRATLMAADYPGLKIAAYNYQQDPMATRHYKKNSEPNFGSVKLCLIDSLTVDAEFHEILADRWLRPMRNPRAREIVAPMLCLPEHGGMVISVRDWLGGEERMGCPLTHEMDPNEREDSKKEEKQSEKSHNSGFGSSLLGGGSLAPAPKEHSKNELGEVLLDKESLKSNEVVVLAMGEDARKFAGTIPNAVRVGSFGFPIPDATLAVVDPETNLLCTPNVIGEIWVDSPSLSGGFWALPKHTDAIFHARPYKFEDANPTPVLVEPEFLRTGLLGCVIEGKVFVLGLYEDRLRQKVEWVEHGQENAEHRYFFVQHLIVSILKNVPKIHDCTAFDVFVNEEHLPIVVLESYAASTAPTTSGGPPRQLDSVLLESLAERCMEVLYQEHHLRVYCVLLTAPNTLPRVTKNGRQEIGNMLCRKDFDAGALPLGVDPVGGIWSPLALMSRQEMLAIQEKQYSGVDYREVVMDDPEELAFCSIDGRGKEGKGITWKKFDLKVSAVATYLRNKVKVRPGDHLVLMYTHSEDYVYAVHACFCLGVVVIPLPPIDQNRLSEDAPAFLHVINDFHVKAIIVNSDVDHVMRQKLVSQHIKQSAQVLRIGVPAIYNTTKPSKQSHGCREMGYTAKDTWLQNKHPALIWTYWTPDQRRISVHIGHDTIMGMCKVQKETCQMTSSRPVLGSNVHLWLTEYLGAPTYLVSPVDFAQNPMTLFVALSRYKIKDTYATSQMLDYAMTAMAAKGFQLQELKNLMISAEGRPRVDIYQKVRLHFASASLDRTAINIVYSHVLNPMVATRSYMCIEPVELWLDLRSLRRGLVYPVDPDTDPTALGVQDSGMVPVNTQIAIVNPETCTLCHVGEYGEIWVQSDACAKSFYGSKQEFDQERFNGRIMDGDPSVAYVRTGDLGFLHSVTRPIGPGGQPVEMQVLFVLGGIGETFEVNGLNHFPMDIENSVERCHRNIVSGGCAVFQAGGLIVVVVEVTRKAYLASLVPVIVDSILNEHQVVADIVAFVSQGDFPRSRLGEKQRGKVLATWITRKLRTIAQFSIRDMEGSENPYADGPQHRVSRSSKPGSVMGNSTRRSTVVPENDVPAVPRSPAPALAEHPEVTIDSYQAVQDPGDGSMLNSPIAVPESAPSIPQIAEPMRPATSSSTGNVPTPNDVPVAIGNPDFGFDFGDFAHSTSTAPPLAGSNGPVAVTEALPYRPATEQGSISGQQQSSAKPRPFSYEQPLDDVTGGWPQEALMYQSTLGTDDTHGQSGNSYNTSSETMKQGHYGY